MSITSRTWFAAIRDSHHWGSSILTLIPGRSIRSIVTKVSVSRITCFMKLIVARFLDFMESLDPLKSQKLEMASRGGVSGELPLFSAALINRSCILSICVCSRCSRVLRQMEISNVECLHLALCGDDVLDIKSRPEKYF